MWKKVALGIVAALILAVLVGFLLPAKVHVERSLQMSAAPEQVYPLISRFANFNRWSPWFKRDPKTVYTFTGTPGTVGAKMAWQSDHPEVGSGSQEYTLLTPNERVETKLDFGEQGGGTATLDIKAVEGGSLVTWSMDTDMGNNPIGRYFGLFFDGMIGPDYEEGLRNLKAIAEGKKGN